MSGIVPEKLAIVAGNGIYPLLLAESAKKKGVARVVVLAFRGETSPEIESRADETVWLRLGRLDDFVEAIRRSGAADAVMAGQITPTALFHVRPDRRGMDLLKNLKVKSAETIFSAIGEELAGIGVRLLPAHVFMESHMPQAGLISKRPPTEREKADVQLGFRVAKVTSGLDIGQTVVIKDGAIIAVEAFEGTNKTIMRARDLCGKGGVVVKTAKRGHDMRFDIPVVGLDTIRLLKKAGAAVLAVEAGRTIVLERDRVAVEADRIGLCMIAQTCEGNDNP